MAHSRDGRPIDCRCCGDMESSEDAILDRGSYWTGPSDSVRNITDPRALALVLEQAEAKLAKEIHPDPYRRRSHDQTGQSSWADRYSTSVPRRYKMVCSPGQ